MFKDLTFKTAFAISVSLHLMALAPWSLFYFKRIEDKKPDIEVTYLLENREELPLDKIIKNLPQKYDLKNKETVIPPQKREKRIKKENVSKNEAAEIKEEYLEEKEVEKLEEYIAYHELIREKIKDCVTRYYKSPAREGRVEAIFTLTENGALKNLAIEGAGDSENLYFAEVARKSIKAATPFPPFPDALNLSLRKQGREELTFSIAIIFKNE